jgi:hypothetical protein
MSTTLKLSSGTLNSERLGNEITYSSLGGKKSNVSKKDNQKTNWLWSHMLMEESLRFILAN